MSDATRRGFLTGAASAAFMACCPAELAAAVKHRRLNILYIMTDDHAAHAISAYGSRINETPNIDELARTGVRFDTVFASNPICAPSRAAILTGQHSHLNGVPVFNAISPEVPTLGGYLRRAGYYTALLGKTHLGGPNTVRATDWTRWMVYQNQGQYFDPFFFASPASAVADEKAKVTPHGANYQKHAFPGEYATENLTRITQEAIDEAQRVGKPFCVMMLHKAPHRNWLPSEKYRLKFRSKTLRDIPPPDTLFDTWEGRASAIRKTAMTIARHMRLKEDLKLAEYFGEGHTFELDGKTYAGKKENGKFVDRWPDGLDERGRVLLAYLRYMQDYLAVVQSVDDSVGEMVAYLKSKGLYESTLIVYTSDQGFFLGDHGLYDKRFMMNEIRMPFIVSCPSLIANPGSVVTKPVSNVDFAPMLLDVAGVKKPGTMQGRSFKGFLEGRPVENWQTGIYQRYYVEGGEHQTAAFYGIRREDYLLTYYYKRDEWELFDLAKDPEELHNVYGKPEYATITETLKKELRALKAKVRDDDRYQDSGEYGPLK